MKLFEAKDFMDKDGNYASPEAAARIANEKVKDFLEEEEVEMDYSKLTDMDLLMDQSLENQVNQSADEMQSVIDFLKREG